jgi:DNA-binding transcriptional LysR family regulator
MESQGYRPNVLMRCESAEAIKLAVLNGMGLGFLYEEHVLADVKKKDLKIVNIDGSNPPKVQSCIVFKKDHSLSSSAQTFLSLMTGLGFPAGRNWQPEIAIGEAKKLAVGHEVERRQEFDR